MCGNPWTGDPGPHRPDARPEVPAVENKGGSTAQVPPKPKRSGQNPRTV